MNGGPTVPQTSIAAADDRPAPRVMLYCHDSYGLGHLRRTLTLSRHLRSRWPATSQLLVTGSPLAHDLVLPDDGEYIKLPSVVKVGAEEYESRSLAMPLANISDLRREIVLSAARHFRPDVLLVDHAPAGLNGEIVQTLRYLRRASPTTRLVVGLRDVVDEGPRVRHAWARDGVYELLDDVYHRILVYGQQDIHDVIAEYGLSPRAAAKTRFVGYLRPSKACRAREEVRSELRLRNDRLVVVVGGGGGDAYALFRTVVEALRSEADAQSLDWLLVGGPLMSASERAELRALLPLAAPARFFEFLPDLASYVGAADVVVSMGGYNAVCEILAAARPAVIVPRVSPRKEQRLRAGALAERGLAEMIDPADLTPRALLERVRGLAEAGARPADARLRLDGLPAVAAELEAILPGSSPQPARPSVSDVRVPV